jgi:hypothetical protein
MKFRSDTYKTINFDAIKVVEVGEIGKHEKCLSAPNVLMFIVTSKEDTRIIGP